MPAEEIYYRELEAEIYDLEYQWKTDDIDYWKSLAYDYVPEDGAALELACGTGRVLFPLAESGVRVVGVDHSPWMLDKAKEKYDRASGPVRERVGLLEGDIRTLQLEQKFNFIYLPFNSFLIMKTVQDQLAVFDVVRRHLAPGGVFAFDIFVPDVRRLVPDNERLWRLEVDQTLGERGVRFMRDSNLRVDPIQQRLFNTFRMREYREHILVREWVADLEMTYIFPRELEHLVAHAGFEFVHYWAHYSRFADFWSIPEPQKQLPVVRPRPS